MRPLTALLLLQSGAIALLAFGPPLVRVYAVSACLYVFAWLGGFPYLLGLLSKLDSGGRLNALMMVVANAAYAIGPASAGYLINAAANEAAGLTYVRSLGLALQVCGSMLILLLAVTHRHSLPVGGGLHPARGQSSWTQSTAQQIHRPVDRVGQSLVHPIACGRCISTAVGAMPARGGRRR